MTRRSGTLILASVGAVLAVLAVSTQIGGRTGATEAREPYRATSSANQGAAAVNIASTAAAASRARGVANGSLPADVPTDPLERNIVVLKIDRPALRELGTFTDRVGRIHRIYFGPTTDGKTCMFETIEIGSAQAGTPLGPQGGGCRPASVTGDKIRWSARFKGSPTKNTGGYVYGIAEPGIARVEFVDNRGTRHQAELNTSRVFFYESASGASLELDAIIGRDSIGKIVKTSSLVD